MLRVVALVAVMVWLTVPAHLRSRVWRNNLTLWTYEAAAQSRNEFVQRNYLTALIEARQPREACRQYVVVEKAFTEDTAWMTDRLLSIALLESQEQDLSPCYQSIGYSVASR